MKLISRRLWDKLIGFLKKGTSPEKLALTCAIGVVVGILPIWGITTFLCFGLAAIFKVNVGILQLVHYAVYPIQLLMIIPFIKAGTFIFGINPMPYSLDQLTAKFSADFWGELKQLGVAIGLGVGVWAVASIPIFAVVYWFTHTVFKRWSKDHQRELKSQ